MSGHSKFANIKHKKEKNDAAKGKVFTRIGREIAVAVRKAEQIRQTTASCVMSLQRQRQTTCQMIPLTAASRRQQEMQMLQTTSLSLTRDMAQAELRSL